MENLTEYEFLGYYGLVDENGKTVISPIYDQIEINEDTIQVTRNGKVGIYNKEGIIMLPAIYDELICRDEFHYDARIQDMWGVIDISGHETTPIKYSERIPSHWGWGKTIVFNQLTKRYGVLDDSGMEIVPSIYEHLKIENDFYLYSCGGIVEDNELIGAKWGCINSFGRIIINPSYDCFRFENEFILAGRDGDFVYRQVEQRPSQYNGVFDLYTQDGDLIIGGFSEFKYDEANKILIFFWGGKWVHCTCKSEHICGINQTYDSMLQTYRDGLWLFLDENLSTIIRDENGNPYQLSEGKIYNYINGKVVLKDSSDQIPAKFMCTRYDRISDNILFIFDNNNWYEENGKDILKSAIDINTGKQTPFFESICYIGASIFYVSENKKVGIRSFDRQILNCEFLFLTIPVEGFYFAGREIDRKRSQVFLKSVNDPNLQLNAIESIETSLLIDYVKKGSFQIRFNGDSHKVKDIVLANYLFKTDFINKVSSVVPRYKPKSMYERNNWYAPDDNRFWPEFDDEGGELCERDKPDYSRDTWYALTDGAYGDYPGSDVDYDGIGF